MEGTTTVGIMRVTMAGIPINEEFLIFEAGPLLEMMVLARYLPI